MMNETLVGQLKFLRLPGLLTRWDEQLKAAAHSNLSHARFLTRVIEEEYRLKCDQARQQRLKLAKIPEPGPIHGGSARWSNKASPSTAALTPIPLATPWPNA